MSVLDEEKDALARARRREHEEKRDGEGVERESQGRGARRREDREGRPEDENRAAPRGAQGARQSESGARAKARREIEALEARLENCGRSRENASESRDGPSNGFPVAYRRTRRSARDGTRRHRGHRAFGRRGGGGHADVVLVDRPRPPEVVLLAPRTARRTPMLVCGDEEEQRWTPGGVGPSAELGFADVATDAHATRFACARCATRRCRWSASFIGCPGIAHADQGPLKTHDFTRLFRADGTRISGHSKKNRTTPLEVTDALGRAAFERAPRSVLGPRPTRAPRCWRRETRRRCGKS